jgi:hypothetical protein
MTGVGDKAVMLTKKLSHKEKEFCYSSFPAGLELAPSQK